MAAHVVYCAGEWNEATMDSQQCDRHPSARAKARVLFLNLCVLYLCGHCANRFEDSYDGEFTMTYETVVV